MDTRVPGSAAQLTDLPTELLGIICRQLSLKESLASSEDAWGELDFTDKRSRGELLFILPWLAHRRRSLQRLTLDFSDVLESKAPHVAAALAASLEDSTLVALHLIFLALPVKEGGEALQWVGSCTALTSLVLCGCGLTCLPDTLKQLTALTGLFINFNHLAAVPVGLAALPALSGLSLQGNPELGNAAEDAWAPLARCSSLNSLHLGGIPFPRLPRALAALAPTLVELDLSLEGEKVPSFKDEASLGPLYMLTGLTWLRLSRCLYDLPMPEKLSCLVGLRFLDLSCNSSQEEGVHFLRHLTALTYLSLCDCGLTEFPKELSCLVALQDLDLNENPLNGEGLAVLRHITALTRLCLGSCCLRDLPEEISHLQALKYLDFGNHVEEFQEHAITHAGWQRLRRLTALTFLDLTDCNLERLPPELAELRSLAELNLCWNELLGGSALDAADKWAALERLTALTELDASCCELQAVPVAFAALSQLQVLILSGNPHLGRGGMEALRPLVRVTALRSLDLTECNLPEELEEDAFPFPLELLEGWAERIEGLSTEEIKELTLD